MTQTSSFRAVLIGRGIGASRSPAIHEAEGVALGVAMSYQLLDFDVLGRSDEDLPATVRALRDDGYAGSNITYPFKQAVLASCDTLSPEAATIGAVNTLVFRDGRIHGENTDWIGFSWQIERDIGIIAGQRIAQVGAGGAGSATALALGKLGAAEVMLTDPDADRAISLAKRLEGRVGACRFTVAPDAASAIADADGVVNATPVGMVKMPGVPFDPALMHKRQWLADIIYFPLETNLLQRATANGQRTANGVSMVVGQAAEALRCFTGCTPDRERMLRRLLATISTERAAAEAA